MTINAQASLRRTGDKQSLFRRTYSYPDRDSLKNWVDGDNARWTEFVDNARRYFTMRVSDDIFQKIILRHVLRSVNSGHTYSLTPEFEWELNLLGGDAYGDWTDQIDDSNVNYNLEIYDKNRLVYAAVRIPDNHHTVQKTLQGCKRYKWSVQPVYKVGDRTRVGEWMRKRTVGLVIMQNAAQHRDERKDFPTFSTPCQSQ